MYSLPTIPEGRLDVVIVRVAGSMVIVRGFVAELVPLEALTVKLNVPELVGVPEIVPVELSVSPEGRVPELTDQEALLTEEANCAV